MKRGRRRKPADFKVIQGNGKAGKALADGNPEFAPVVVRKPPDYLKGAGRELWLENYANMEQQGLITAATLPNFIMLCHAWAGIVEDMRAGKKLPPGATAEMRRLFGEFGMSPNAIGGVTGAQKTEDKNPFAELYKLGR